MTVKKPHPLNRAWAAGVFEARISWPRTGYVLRFDSVDEPMMRRFAEIVGVGVLMPREHKNCSHTVWMFKTQKMDDTRELLLLMSPFLTGHRVKFASDIIAKIERNSNWQKRCPEKVPASVIIPAPTAEAETTQPNTPMDGFTASPPVAEKTGD